MAEKKIAGMEIRVDRPLATEALKLQARLTRAAGGDIQSVIVAGLGTVQALAEKKAAEAVGKQVSDEALAAAGGKLLGIIAGIFERLSPDEYVQLVGDILSHAKIKRPSGHYEDADLDGDFSDNLGAIIPVATFVLKEIFSDFFSGPVAGGNRARAGKG